ncbi:MAG: hypothetical protein Q4D21_08505 [Phascolarctobacterium sp.]|nr:hypothetical protein [Phascolarctobacterium sp.]
MLNKMMKRTIALVLAAVTFGLPLMTNDALAASRNDQKPAQKVERRVDQKAPQKQKVEKRDNHRDNDKRNDVKHDNRRDNDRHQPQQKVVYKPAPSHHDHSSSNEKLATGLVIGAILGAVIANAS